MGGFGKGRPCRENLASGSKQSIQYYYMQGSQPNTWEHEICHDNPYNFHCTASLLIFMFLKSPNCVSENNKMLQVYEPQY